MSFSISFICSSVPWASMLTEPSHSFLTQPVTLSPFAAYWALYLKPTPWTEPVNLNAFRIILCRLIVINHRYFLHQLFCSIHQLFQMYCHFICKISFSTLGTFHTWYVFYNNHTILIIYHMSCCRLHNFIAFTIHTHITHAPFLFFHLFQISVHLEYKQ